MRYDKRIQLIRVGTKMGYLGDTTEVELPPEDAVCAISGLTNSDKQTYFKDQYKVDGFRVHLQGPPGRYDGLKYVIRDGVKHEFAGRRILRNSLVVIVG